jgi:hypothetical protein
VNSPSARTAPAFLCRHRNAVEMKQNRCHLFGGMVKCDADSLPTTGGTLSSTP